MLRAHEALDHKMAPWLFAVVVATVLPHLWTLPLWVDGLSAAIGAWSFLIWLKFGKPPKNWLIALILALLAGAMYAQYKTIFGREVGTAMLQVLLMMKILEIRSQRDHYIIIILCYFLLFTYFFQSQTPLTTAWMFAVLWLLTTALIRVFAPQEKATQLFKLSAKLIALALPLMLVFYVLFPRNSGPLWGLPESTGQTKGLSERMSPGDIASLVQNNDVAFRVHFKGTIPPPMSRYWRGLVMEYFDGRQWSYRISAAENSRIASVGNSINYQMTLEPHGLYWVPTLEMQTEALEGTQTNSSNTYRTLNPITQRLSFAGTAYLRYQYNSTENSFILKNNLRLPAHRNPRTVALATSWRAEGLSARDIVARALAMYAQQHFVYTLQPPLLGEDPVDQFLFETRQGFCEHFASSFTTLMRAAGIPARVVAGYQGGEINPLSKVMTIRESDAHVWVEVWLPEIGWQRQDPTANVAPNRIVQGATESMGLGLNNDTVQNAMRRGSPWLRQLYYRWEALEADWNLWVLGYNRDRQSQLLQGLGMNDISWANLSAWMIGLVSLFFIGLFFGKVWQRPRRHKIDVLWQRALKAARRLGITLHPWEPPLTIQAKLSGCHQEIVDTFAAVVNGYCQLRYAKSSQVSVAQLEQSAKIFIKTCAKRAK